MFEVYFGNKRAKKDYENLDVKSRAKINELCEVLQKVPVPFKEYDVRKIEGREDNYRIRFGKFRVLYNVDEISHLVYILKIERRSETTYK